MDVLGDVVARNRRSRDVAIRAVPLDRRMTYHDFCTTAYKAGNFLRYLGVGDGAEVALSPTPTLEPILAFFGTALLGAVSRFDPRSESARAAVVDSSLEPSLGSVPGRRVAVFGGSPAGVDIVHWETAVWSENPAFPHIPVSPDAPALLGTETYTHERVLRAARRVADEWSIDSSTAVAVRASLSDPRVVVGGVVAPLLAGGTVVFPDESKAADLAMSTGAPPESDRFTPEDVPL